PGVAEAGRPLRCRSRTSLVSHGRVSDSFPGRYAARTVLLQVTTMISATFRVVRYASSHVTDLPAAAPRRGSRPGRKVTFRQRGVRRGTQRTTQMAGEGRQRAAHPLEDNVRLPTGAHRRRMPGPGTLGL